MASWILPKNEHWGNFQYIKLPQHSFFGRIQYNIFFRDFLTFNHYSNGPLLEKQQIYLCDIHFDETKNGSWPVKVLVSMLPVRMLTLGCNLVIATIRKLKVSRAVDFTKVRRPRFWNLLVHGPLQKLLLTFRFCGRVPLLFCQHPSKYSILLIFQGFRRVF